MLGGIAVVGLILSFVITQFIQGCAGTRRAGERQLQGRWVTWLTQWVHCTSTREQIDQRPQVRRRSAAEQPGEADQRGAVDGHDTVTEIVTGALLVLFTLIFVLHGGRNIYGFVTKVFPENVRERVRDAGRAGFRSLIGYVRATVLVAFVDAVGIGIGLAAGYPLALPLAALVFLGAFIPVVGATLSGVVAVSSPWSPRPGSR